MAKGANRCSCDNFCCLCILNIAYVFLCCQGYLKIFINHNFEEVTAAAKAVCAHEFIMETENGYQTEVNERGSRLSVGERQLISFARALLADPRILILDEATANIDTRTEKALQEGLNRLLKGRTSFIIAHRLSTIQHSSLIMVVDKGRIVESGNHSQLLAREGEYYKLFMSQWVE